ncbi:MAG TPA: hypothetical protein VIO94_12625 [Phenylobacterium sp.]
MQDFSIAEAGTEGFRLARERPVAIAFWAVAQLIYGLVTITILVGIGGTALADLQAASASGDQAADPAVALAAMRKIAPAYGLVMIAALLFFSVLITAAMRAVLKPQEDRLGYMRFGADELRVMVVMLIIGVLMFLAYLGMVLVGAIVMGVLAASAGPVGGGIGAAILIVGVLLGVGWLWSRLSLAPAATLAKGTVDAFGSWELTRGKAGKVFATNALAFALNLLVVLLGFAIFMGVAAVVGGSSGAVSAIMKPDMSSLGAYFTPLTILYTVMMSIVGAMGSAIMMCPPAVMYRELAGDTLQEVF